MMCSELRHGSRLQPALPSMAPRRGSARSDRRNRFRPCDSTRPTHPRELRSPPQHCAVCATRCRFHDSCNARRSRALSSLLVGAALNPQLSLLEARILGVLVEKELTVPDIYPLSSNALTAGCNQRNNRNPVLNASEVDVHAAIDRLKPLSLVIESSGSRVMRYSQNIGRALKVPSEAVALLAALWLRGPQTAAELRAATERLHRFADVSSVEGFLTQLAARSLESGWSIGAIAAARPRRTRVALGGSVEPGCGIGERGAAS